MAKNTESVGAAKTPRQAAHTPEPWRIVKTPPSFIVCSQPIGDNKAGVEIVSTYLRGGDDQANAERIVSCVNALEGVKNPAAVAGLVRVVERTLNYWDGYDGKFLYRDCRLHLIAALAALDTPVPQKEKEKGL